MMHDASRRGRLRRALELDDARRAYTTPVIIDWRDAPWSTRWPNFTPKELACGAGSCRHCGGKLVLLPLAIDRLQRLRTIFGRPVVINSAHRCPRRNLDAGGARASQHLIGVAYDLACPVPSLRRPLYEAARAAGFDGGFGFYRTFLHVDLGAPRFWAEQEGLVEQWLSGN